MSDNQKPSDTSASKPESELPPSGSGQSVTFGGSVQAGRDVVGMQNYYGETTQTSYQIDSSTREEITELLNVVRKQLAAQDLSPEERASAKHDVNTLEQELTESKKPDANKIENAGESLLRKVPALTGAVAGLFTHPAVGKVLTVAGEVALSWVQTRFGAGNTPPQKK